MNPIAATNDDLYEDDDSDEPVGALPETGTGVDWPSQNSAPAMAERDEMLA